MPGRIFQRLQNGFGHLAIAVFDGLDHTVLLHVGHQRGVGLALDRRPSRQCLSTELAFARAGPAPSSTALAKVR